MRYRNIIRMRLPEHDPELRETVARHGEQLQDHDRVIRSLERHLADLLKSFNAFQTKVLVAAAIVFAGSHQGSAVLKLLGIG
jgi:hypothetical protein